MKPSEKIQKIAYWTCYKRETKMVNSCLPVFKKAVILHLIARDIIAVEFNSEVTICVKRA